MDYTLTLNVAPTDLEVINGAQQKIALAKPVGNSKVDVIWLAFDPFESNTIQWSEEYWLYASTAAVGKSGEKITKLSEVQPGPAMNGSIYPFSNNATFGTPVKSPDVATDTFAAVNNMSYEKYPALTFGLSQSAQVNQEIQDRKPLSASSVLATQSIQITPFTHVYIWLEGHFESSTIITDITGLKSVAKFGGGTNEIAMTYDGKSGSFHQ
ncbi:hypothetical protein O4H49_05930 [Kiloniella laminariae]|uniref:Uncharacterized protein n=1 Tax=Kiloniella laminariae TaxID=454162 RepID=A0ABT4LIX1_9PROT|nr:hypothetical protein [Kiloniella laminariae]MCZ4280306.1 hypothetical protein [Kiloniella laminariae]